MNVDLIRIEPAVAKAKLKAYRSAIAATAHTKAKAEVNAEYERIANAYAAAGKGLPLIELTRAMAMGGWDEQGRPKFAVGHASAKRVSCHVGHDNELCFSTSRACYRQHGLNGRRFRLRDLPARPVPANQFRTWQAIVPIVPPDVLPRPDLDLSRRLILWEADWRRAPEDPLLLLPLGGDLYAVEAAWDLTALERAILSDRRNGS